MIREQDDKKRKLCMTGKEIVKTLSASGIEAGESEEFRKETFTSLFYHSGKAEKGGLLFIKGSGFRKEYLEEAVSRGISGYVAEQLFETDVPRLLVSDCKEAMGIIAREFYKDPQKEMITAAVTGTNGKTTTVHFLEKIFEIHSGRRPGYIATDGCFDGTAEQEMHMTTPESADSYSVMRSAADCGSRYFVMECSSQSEKMKRLAGMQFDVGVFTNITDDHYSPLEHSSFEEYLSCKLGIVKRFRNAVVNLDDPHSKEVIAAAAGVERIVTCSVHPKTGADVYVGKIKNMGLHPVFTAVTPEWEEEIEVPMPGLFNISNALQALAAGYVLGIGPETIAEGIKRTFVHGRMYVTDINGYLAVVDYAHNFAAVQSALREVRELYPKKEIVMIFGCQGTTGLQRRKDMVVAAEPFVEKLLITNDDPHDVDPQTIIREIESYAKDAGIPYETVTDRKECIEKAVREMTLDKILFVAAKGNEHFIKAGKTTQYYEGDLDIVNRALYERRDRDLDHEDYRTWRTYDPYYNREEMWPASEYPEARLRYIKKGGCFVVALAMMLRHYGIVSETGFDQFNPLILCEKIKSVNGFGIYGEVDMEKLTEIFSIRIIDTIPYEKEKLEQSLKSGFICQIIVKGHQAPQHYVVPVAVTKEDVEVLDPTWGRRYISEQEPIWIARYQKTGGSK